MTQYLKGQFSVLPPTSDEFRSNWERTFRGDQNQGTPENGQPEKKPYVPPVIKSYAPIEDEPTDPGLLPCVNCRGGGHEHCLSPGTCRCYFCLSDRHREVLAALGHALYRNHDFNPTGCDGCAAGKKLMQ